jgi:hypothetical protein
MLVKAIGQSLGLLKGYRKATGNAQLDSSGQFSMGIEKLMGKAQLRYIPMGKCSYWLAVKNIWEMRLSANSKQGRLLSSC